MTTSLDLHMGLLRLRAEPSNLQRMFDEVPSASGVARQGDG
ncbi:hypothetical protein [Variovorax sp. W2I14]